MVVYLLREWLVASALHLQLMSAGITISFPSILAPALYGNQTDIHATPEEIDMIMGSFGLYATLTVMIFPAVMQLYGRKATVILLNLSTITGSICVALGANIPTLIAGRFIQGFAFGGYYMGSLIVSEYVHPKRRGAHLVIKGMFGGIGELLCHTLGLTILTYKQVAWMAVVTSVLSIIMTLQWPESPSFLAYKGRFKECTNAFEWIRGTDHEAKKELRELILFQEESRKQAGSTSLFVRTLEAFKKKDFWKPLSISVLLGLVFQASGALTLIMYINEIIIRIAGDKSVAFRYTVGLDLMRTLSHVAGGFVVRFFRRRVVLFSSSSVSCFLMALLIVLYYLDKIGAVNLKWLNPFLLVAYYIVISVLVVPIVLVAQAEILPLKYKGLGGAIVTLSMAFSSSLQVQYSWTMINVLDIHGIFSVFLVCESVFLMLIYKLLPETTHRTLQNIENEFVKLNVVYDEVELKVIDELVKNELPKLKIVGT